MKPAVSDDELPHFLYFPTTNKTINSPWVVHSSSEPMSGTTPLSTLIPAMIPFFFINWTNGVPSSVFWYKVSWNKMTPETFSASFGSVVNKSWRYWRRLSSLFSTPISYEGQSGYEIRSQSHENLFNTHRQTLSHGGNGFISSKDAFTGSNDCLGDTWQLLLQFLGWVVEIGSHFDGSSFATIIQRNLKNQKFSLIFLLFFIYISGKFFKFLTNFSGFLDFFRYRRKRTCFTDLKNWIDDENEYVTLNSHW